MVWILDYFRLKRKQFLKYVQPNFLSISNSSCKNFYWQWLKSFFFFCIRIIGGFACANWGCHKNIRYRLIWGMIISRENLILSILYIIGTQRGLTYLIHILMHTRMFLTIFTQLLTVSKKMIKERLRILIV